MGVWRVLCAKRILSHFNSQVTGIYFNLFDRPKVLLGKSRDRKICEEVDFIVLYENDDESKPDILML